VSCSALLRPCEQATRARSARARARTGAPGGRAILAFCVLGTRSFKLPGEANSEARQAAAANSAAAVAVLLLLLLLLRISYGKEEEEESYIH
jgi:hypothetical protein